MTAKAMRSAWAAAMVELLNGPINQARVIKVLRILGSEVQKQGVLDV